jgi:hypothetical protein
MKHPMPGLSTKRNLRSRAFGGAFALVLAVGVLAPSPAQAHFTLDTPASWMSQDALGLPEKLGPCGDEGGGTVTNTITALHPGETVTITINEVIFHPGHYRIALATDRSLLPAEPVVTAGSTPCGSVPVDTAPVFPVLADGLFDHTAAFTSPQTTTITLPTNLTCTKCTLQVIEFMSDHPLNNPGGCFYHHCADISIQAGADADGSAGDGIDGSTGSGGDASVGGGPGPGPVPEAGTVGGGVDAGVLVEIDATTGGPAFQPAGQSASSGGCGVFSGPSGGAPAVGGLAGLFGIAALIRRRRRAARSR